MDVGGKPAQALSEFYASIFSEILQASQSASLEKFDHAIECVRNVRDAWRQVAKDPDVNPAPLQAMANGGDSEGSRAITPGNRMADRDGTLKSREQGTGNRELGMGSRE